MAIHLAFSERDVVNARWRPDHIISHLESPTYDPHTRRLTYAQVLGRVLPGSLQGVWCVKDVHIVDADVAELMAVLKASWSRRRFHLILVSPSPDAGLRWAAYLGCDTPSRVPVRHSSSIAPLLVYVPHAAVIHLFDYIDGQELKGDVLIFAKSAAHRDALRDALTCYHLRVPLVLVYSHLPYSAGPPRVLVGTPTLDFMLDTPMASRIQHVIDFGTVYRIRQDTANDWEEDTITRTMADARTTAANKVAPGACLRIYADEASLRNDTLATHKLLHDLCQAKILVRCGRRYLDKFPVALQPTVLSPSVARLMDLLEVEAAVARIVHRAPVVAMGIGVAAIMGRHSGPCARQNYDACISGSIPQNVMKYLKAWASRLGLSHRKVVKTLQQTTWEEVLPLIRQGYRDNMAIAAGTRGQYIAVKGGDILRWRYASTDAQAIVYTHRQGNHVVSCVQIQAFKTALQTTRVRSPLRLTNDVPIEAMQAWFEARNVVASLVSATEVNLACGAQVELSAVVAEWTEVMRHKALETPVVVPLGPHNMSMVLTAGLRFSDAVNTADFLVMACELNTLTTQELLKIHETPGLWNHKNQPSMTLGTRKAAEGLWDHISNVSVRAVGAGHSTFQPATVGVRLMVKVYLGKSTGRALVHGIPSSTWISRVQPAWKWDIQENVDLVSMYTPKAVAATLTNLPEHMDENDIAELLQLEPRHIAVERTVQLLTHLPCVTRLFRALDPENVTQATRSLRCTEFSMEVQAAAIPRALRLVYDTLPATNQVVNQPLRVHWSLSTTTGSHPPADHSKVMHTSITIDRRDFGREIGLVHVGLGAAIAHAARLTPTFLWLPALAVPWVHVDLPHVEHTGGPLFRLYGPKQRRETNKRAMRELAAAPPCPPLATYETCVICFEPRASYQLGICGCRFCLPCLAQAFDIKCMDPDFVGEFQCPTCRERVGVEDLSVLLRPKALRTFAVRMAKFMSARIPLTIMQCPSQCGFFGRVRPGQHQETLECRKCKTDWCMRCSDKMGQPVAAHKGFCDKRWNSEFWAAFATEATLAGARACPQCGTYVVKDGGCSHVACSAPNCQTHFCWKCVQAFSHVQSSPPAQGVIQDIQEDVVTIAVDKDTWHTPCQLPAPTLVTYKLDFARKMLLENEVFVPQARVWVYSYIYDHLDACACD